MDQVSTPSSLYGGGRSNRSTEKLSPVSSSSFRAFSRNLMLGGHPGGGASTSAGSGLPAPVTLLNDPNPSIDKKIRLFEDKVTRHTSVEDTKLSLFEEQLRKTFTEVDVLKEDREKFTQSKMTEISRLAEVMNEKINILIRSRQEVENKNEERVCSDLISLEAEVKKLRNAREDAQGKAAKKIGEGIADVQAEFSKVKELRMQQGERIATVIHDELIDVHNEIVSVKEARIASEKEMMKMVEDMCFRIRSEIDNERELRQHGEEQLLQLLEETCNRVEANFQLSNAEPTRRRY